MFRTRSASRLWAGGATAGQLHFGSPLHPAAPDTPKATPSRAAPRRKLRRPTWRLVVGSRRLTASPSRSGAIGYLSVFADGDLVEHERPGRRGHLEAHGRAVDLDVAGHDALGPAGLLVELDDV